MAELREAFIKAARELGDQLSKRTRNDPLTCPSHPPSWPYCGSGPPQPMATPVNVFPVGATPLGS